MNLIIVCITIIVISLLFVKTAKRISLPSVVALIISGLVWNIPVLNNLIAPENLPTIFNIGDFALVCLMFLAGLEVSKKNLKREGREALTISIIAATFAFTLGTVALLLLGYSALISIVVGISLAVTAEATTAEFLLEVGKTNSRIGTLMLEAGIIDDVLGILIFMGATLLLGEFKLEENIVLIFSLFAFFLGLFTQKRLNHYKEYFEKYLSLLIIPFFFVSMGMHFEIHSLVSSPWIIGIIIILALVGKIGGTLITKPLSSLSWKQLHLVGWAMNSRGAVGLALPLIALKDNLISPDIYSAIMVMVLLTTLSFPLAAHELVREDASIWN